MKNTNETKNIKFKNNKFDELINDYNFGKLPAADRALIYTMYWANSEKSTRDRYEFDRIIDMAKKLKNLLKSKKYDNYK